MKTCKHIFTVDDVIDLNPVFKGGHALDILHMVRDVFDDFELDMNSYEESVDEDLNIAYDVEYGGIYEDDARSKSSDIITTVGSGESELSGVMEL